MSGNEKIVFCSLSTKSVHYVPDIQTLCDLIDQTFYRDFFIEKIKIKG